MIDIEKLARESGASRGVVAGLDWWRFSPDELQLYTEKVMLAAQAEERGRAKELVEALRYARRYLKKELHDTGFVDAAIAKYEDEK
jgi:hypothetical protein